MFDQKENSSNLSRIKCEQELILTKNIDCADRKSVQGVSLQKRLAYVNKIKSMRVSVKQTLISLISSDTNTF